MTTENSGEPMTEIDEEALFQQLSGNGADAGTESADLPTGDVDDAATDAPASSATEEGGQPLEGAGEAGVTEDVWATATPAQKQAWQDILSERARLEHAESSNRNRVSALQRKLDEQEAQLKQLRSLAPTPPASGGAAGAPAAASADLAKFAEDFPEVFAAMRALQAQETAQLHEHIAGLQNQLSTVAQPIAEMQQTRAQQVKQVQLQALAARHPDYIQIQNTPEFWTWLDTQSPGVRALVGSDSAEDNSILLDVYKKSRPAPVAAPASAPEAPRRPREAEARETLPRSGVSRVEGEPTDEDAMWDYWSRRANKR